MGRKRTERLAYPSRRGYKRLSINYFILDMLMYSFLLGSIYFVYLSKIEDVWEFYVYNEKLFFTFLTTLTVSFSAAFITKLIVGSQNRVLTIKKLFIMAISSFLTGLILYIDIIMIIFNEYSFITTTLAVLGLKIINTMFSYALGGALI